LRPRIEAAYKKKSGSEDYAMVCARNASHLHVRLGAVAGSGSAEPQPKPIAHIVAFDSYAVRYHPDPNAHAQSHGNADSNRDADSHSLAYSSRVVNVRGHQPGAGTFSELA
jgi:hypothetical protein